MGRSHYRQLEWNAVPAVIGRDYGHGSPDVSPCELQPVHRVTFTPETCELMWTLRAAARWSGPEACANRPSMIRRCGTLPESDGLSVHLGAGERHDLTPFRKFSRQECAELSGGEDDRRSGDLGKLRLHRGGRQARKVVG